MFISYLHIYAPSQVYIQRLLCFVFCETSFVLHILPFLMFTTDPNDYNLKYL